MVTRMTMKDICGKTLIPGQRVLIAYAGHIKDCYYLYNIKDRMVFSHYAPFKDEEFSRNMNDKKKASEILAEKRYNPLLHNHYKYLRYVYENSFFIIDENTDNLPIQLKKYIK